MHGVGGDWGSGCVTFHLHTSLCAVHLCVSLSLFTLQRFMFACLPPLFISLWARGWCREWVALS